MSELKAKLYRTATVYGFPQESSFKHGDVVKVELVGKGAFGFNFRVSADYLGKQPEVISQSNLKDFCL